MKIKNIVSSDVTEGAISSALGKVGSKVLPGLGMAAGAYDTYNRVKAGDQVGAAIAGGTAAASTLPIVGTGAALLGTGIQAARDKMRTGSWFPDQEEIVAANKPNSTKVASASNGSSEPLEEGPIDFVVKNAAPVAKAVANTARDLPAVASKIGTKIANYGTDVGPGVAKQLSATPKLTKPAAAAAPAVNYGTGVGPGVAKQLSATPKAVAPAAAKAAPGAAKAEPVLTTAGERVPAGVATTAASTAAKGSGSATTNALKNTAKIAVPAALAAGLATQNQNSSTSSAVAPAAASAAPGIGSATAPGASSTSGNSSFGDAFKAARQQQGGAGGKFTWNGNEYQTNIRGEPYSKNPVSVGQGSATSAAAPRSAAPASNTASTAAPAPAASSSEPSQAQIDAAMKANADNAARVSSRVAADQSAEASRAQVARDAAGRAPSATSTAPSSTAPTTSSTSTAPHPYANDSKQAAIYDKMSPEDQAWATKGNGRPDLTDPYIAARSPGGFKSTTNEGQEDLNLIRHLASATKQVKEIGENMNMKDMMEKISALAEAKMADIKGKKHSGKYGSEHDTDEEGEEKSRGGQEKDSTKDAKKWQGADDAGSHVIKGKPASSSKKGKAHSISDKAPKSAPADEKEWLRKEEEREKAAKKKSLKDWIETTEDMIAETAKNKYAIGMAAAKKQAGYGAKPAHDLPKKVIKKGHEIAKKIKEGGEQLPSPPDEVHLPKKGSKNGPVDVYRKKTNEAGQLKGGQKKLDVAPPKGKLDAKDFAALRSKKKVKEGVNFAEMMRETQMTIEEMLIELQSHIEEYKTTGHMSDELRDALDLHKHSKRDIIGEVAPVLEMHQSGETVFWRGQTGTVDRVEGNKCFVNKPSGDMDVWPANECSKEKQSAFGVFKKDLSDIGTGLKGFLSGKSEVEESPFGKAFEMKQAKQDLQLESWGKELDSLLNESMNISTTSGDDGHDSVTVTATEGNAHELLELLRNAGMGGIHGGGKSAESPYGAPMGDETALVQVHGPEVIDGGDSMMDLIKKMSGIGSDESRGQDYEDENSNDSHEMDIEPESYDDSEDHEDEHEETSDQEDSGEEDNGEESDSEESNDEEEVDESYGQADEGNMFTGNLAKARAAGEEEADLDGDGDMEKVREGDETCNECGYTMESCGCEKIEEGEYANSDDGQAMQDIEFMTRFISGGLNKEKTMHHHGYHQGDNPMAMRESNDSISSWKKLSGIK
jgi:hypothetical protein